MRIELAERTHVGLLRAGNEDALLAMPARGIFMVADGMGGEEAGEEASAQAVASVRTTLEEFLAEEPEDPEMLGEMLREALQQANRDVHAIAERHPNKRGMGSTASLLCLHRDAWFVAQVGDSRVYLMRDGVARLLTRDQTVVWELYQQGMIDRDQVNDHPGRHLLTQCIGSGEDLAVDMSEGRLRDQDLFMVCSDGLTGYASEETIFSILADPVIGIDAMADRLIDSALAGGGGDNVSLILVQVEMDEEEAWLTARRGLPRAPDSDATQPAPDQTESYD